MMQSDAPIKYNPFSGERIVTFDKLYLWRGDAHVWYFNPWTGEKRHLDDVNCDKHGYMIQPPDQLAAK